MQQKILKFLNSPAIRHCLSGTRSIAVAAAFAGVLTSQPAGAQGLFSPAIQVNDKVITQYELDQRILFMSLLRIPGNPEEQARKALIEDRLKQQAVSEAGIAVAPEDINQGIENLSSRTQLTREEFVKALGEGGVAPETLRDYVKIGISWREYVTQRFLSQARPTEQEIDRAIGQGGTGSGIQVLLSEIIMPLTPENFEQVDAVSQQIALLKGYDAFSEAAARYSATDTRENGGRLGWLSINNLPPALQAVILELRPGEITTPISLPNAVALFQMRGIRESAVTTPRYSAIEYASYFIAGGRSPEALATAKRVSDQIDTCDDLYGIAREQPPEVLERQSLAPKNIPRDVAIELAKLDEGEISTALTRSNGATLVLLMMCGRTSELGDEASREDVANALAQQRLNVYADSYLQQLLAEARIIER